MNRRGFLASLAAAVAGSTLDPERALWIPNRRVYSIPRTVRLPLWVALLGPDGSEIRGAGYRRQRLDDWEKWIDFGRAEDCWGTVTYALVGPGRPDQKRAPLVVPHILNRGNHFRLHAQLRLGDEA